MSTAAVLAPCPACAEKRFHTEEEWQNHPLRGHGNNGSVWTHPEAKTAHDLEIAAAKKTGAS